MYRSTRIMTSSIRLTKNKGQIGQSDGSCGRMMAVGFTGLSLCLLGGLYYITKRNRYLWKEVIAL